MSAVLELRRLIRLFNPSESSMQLLGEGKFVYEAENRTLIVQTLFKHAASLRRLCDLKHVNKICNDNSQVCGWTADKARQLGQPSGTVYWKVLIWWSLILKGVAGKFK